MLTINQEEFSDFKFRALHETDFVSPKIYRTQSSEFAEYSTLLRDGVILRCKVSLTRVGYKTGVKNLDLEIMKLADTLAMNADIYEGSLQWG